MLTNNLFIIYCIPNRLNALPTPSNLSFLGEDHRLTLVANSCLGSGILNVLLLLGKLPVMIETSLVDLSYMV